jgi:hypothetical protein
MTIFRNHGDNIIGAVLIVAGAVALLCLLAPSMFGPARATLNAALHAVSSMCCTPQQQK